MNLEETRKKYETDLSQIFTSIEDENRQIGDLLSSTHFLSSGLDYARWRTHILSRFKNVALKDASSIEDELYVYEEPPVRDDLNLAQVNVYLHRIGHLVGVKLPFRMKVWYGRVAEDGSFQAIEERF